MMPRCIGIISRKRSLAKTHWWWWYMSKVDMQAVTGIAAGSKKAKIKC